MIYRHQGEIWSGKWNLGGKRNKSKSFSARKTGFRNWRNHYWESTWDQKEKRGKRKTIMAKFLNYKQCEKVLNKYKELKIWEDQIYINEDFSKHTVEKRRNLFKSAKEIRERGEFAKVVYSRLVSYSVPHAPSI